LKIESATSILERLFLYWIGEPLREDTSMEFPYRPEIVDEAGLHFDQVVEQIFNKNYEIKKVPERKVCKECDLRIYCGREGVIRLGEVDDSILSGQG